jgi:hypothetical protein
MTGVQRFIPEPVTESRYAADAPASAVQEKGGLFWGLPALTDTSESLRKRLFAIVVFFALIITGARCLAPFEVGKDQALQLQAAIRLVDGRGLTCTYDMRLPPEDISQPLPAQVLTWWPPTFSLLVAGLLKAGLGIAASLKLIYALVSIIGWIGWGAIATVFFGAPLAIAGRRLPIGFLIAALAPVFFTLSWGGTDIILWAGIPYVVIGLYKSGQETRPGIWLAMAGGLFGILYGVRYATSLVAIAALGYLVLMNLSDLKALAKKLFVFFGASALAILPVVLFVRIYSEQGGPLPDYVDASYGVTRLGQTLHRIFNYLPVTSNSVFCMPLFEEAILNRINMRALNYAFGLFCLVILLGLPAIAFKLHSETDRKGPWKIALALAFLPLSLVTLLVAMVFITDQLMIEVSRYHEPLRLYCIMLYYGLATATAVPRLVKTISLGLLSLFLGFILLYLPARAMMPVKQDDIVRFVLGYTPDNSRLHTSTSKELHYPGNQLYTLKEASREKLRALHATNPDAIFYASGYPFFVYDDCRSGAPCPGVQLRKMPDKKFWSRAYTSRPLKVFWVLNRPSDLPELLPESNRRPVATDVYEKTYIFESDFPAGYRFAKQRDKASDR